MGEAISVCWEESQPPDIWRDIYQPDDFEHASSHFHVLSLPLTPPLFQGQIFVFTIAYKARCLPFDTFYPYWMPTCHS